MTDLVKRLEDHAYNTGSDLSEEAGWEIERLQAENERLKDKELKFLDCVIAREQAWAELRILLKRQELLEKVVEAADKLCAIPPHRMQRIQEHLDLEKTLAALKEQT